MNVSVSIGDGFAFYMGKIMAAVVFVAGLMIFIAVIMYAQHLHGRWRRWLRIRRQHRS